MRLHSSPSSNKPLKTSSKKPAKFFWVCLSLLILTIISIAISLTIGSVNIDVADILHCFTQQCTLATHEVILWQIRLPRVLVAVVAGVGLACAGAILQNITRNPLADPYLFGIISGAGLGATLATLLSHEQLLFTLPLAAFLGALFAILLVFGIGALLNSMKFLLLTGVAVSFMLAAISHFILYLGDPFASNRVIFWLMGSLARVEMLHFYLISAITCLVLFFLFAYHRHIDALLLGDEYAMNLGVNVSKLRLILLALCAANTAVIVAYCGGIGFVGLMIPHIARYFVGVTSARLITGSALIGAIFLIWVDVIARSAFNNIEIPLGIITSAIGSLFFLFVMVRSQAKSS